MDLEEIVERAKFYTKLIWNKELVCNIRINSRLRSTLGQFAHFNNNAEPDRIELAKRLLDKNKFFIIDVLLHELTHWYLYSINKDNRDGCKEFEDELKRVGATSTKSTYDREQGMTFLKDLYVYQCPKCQLELRITTYIHSGHGHDDGYKCWRCGENMGYRGSNQLEQFEFTPSDKLIDYEVKYLTSKITR